jgi:hypothetical protein
MQPVGRPNIDAGGEGSSGGEGGSGGKAASCCAAWWQSLHLVPCLWRASFHFWQTPQMNCTQGALPGHAKAVERREWLRVRERSLMQRSHIL